MGAVDTAIMATPAEVSSGTVARRIWRRATASMEFRAGLVLFVVLALAAGAGSTRRA